MYILDKVFRVRNKDRMRRIGFVADTVGFEKEVLVLSYQVAQR